jgi:hypothetical protein
VLCRPLPGQHAYAARRCASPPHTSAHARIYASGRAAAHGVLVAPLPGLPRTKSIRVATPYTTVDELVSSFWRFCEPDACFVPSQQLRPVGLHATFAILLRDGRPVLRGRCVVDAAYGVDAAATSPHQRAGLRLRIRRLSSDSSPIYAQLLAQRAAAIPEPVPDDATMPNPFEPSYSATPTVAVEALPHAETQSRPRAAFPALTRPTILGVPPMRAPGTPTHPLLIRTSRTTLPRQPLLRRLLRALLTPLRALLPGRSRPRSSARPPASAHAPRRSQPA